MGSRSGVDGTLDVSIVSAAPYSYGATPITASSGIVAASSSTQTLPGVAGKTTYMTGFEITGAGATAASVISVSVFLQGAAQTLYYALVIPAGVTTSITPLIVEFPIPVSSGAANSVIQVIMPSFGTGNTAACLTVHGFQL